MTPERWRQIEQLFHAALNCPPDERALLLEHTEPEIRARVERMLEVESGSGIPGQSFDSLVSGAIGTFLAPGTELGPYGIESLIGEGGMGAVYRAIDRRLGRTVAIKVASARYSERFHREAQAISTLNHPHICTVHDVGPNYLVMEYIEGPTLAEEIRKGPLAPEAAARYGAQIAEALAEAHSRGIIHRDLKPSNVMLTRHGVKVVDFGLAKMLAAAGITQSYAVMGTPAYMAPEQAKNQDPTHTTDLFALGLVLFEMFVGRLPFPGASLGQMLSSGVSPPAPVPSRERAGVPRSVDAQVAALLEKDPARRPQSANEVARQLSIIAGNSGAPPSRRRLRPVYAVAPIVLLLGLAALVYFRTKVPPRGSSIPGSPTAYTQLTSFTDSASGPVLSRDGRLLAFYRSINPFLTPDDIWIKLLPGGEPVRVTHDPRPKYNVAFSPDGARIAYTAMGSFFETYTVSSLGGDPQLLFPNAAGLSWLDDGRLLFSQIRTGVHMGVVTSNADRSGLREIYFPVRERGMAHYSHLSPDKRWVLLAEMDPAWQACRVVPFAGGSPGTQVGPPGAPCVSAAWSPDGKWIYLAVRVAGRFHLWRQRFPGGQPEQMTFGSTEESGIAVAPDGRSLITSISTTQNTVWIHDAHGDRALSTEGYAVGAPGIFSSDGRRLYYLLRRDSPESPAELVCADIASGKAEVVTPGISIGEYDISKDEKQVVFSTERPGQPSELWISPLDRSAPPRRISAGAEERPLFGEHNQVLYRYTEGSAYYLGAMNFNGADRRKALPMKVLSVDHISPDGRIMILGTGLTGTAYREPGIAAVSLADGHMQVICRAFCTARWSRDGRYFCIENSSGKTVIIRIPPGKTLPSFPRAAVRNWPEWTRVPGVEVIAHANVAPGPDPSIYAYVKPSVHANLFRIPVR